MKPFEKENAFDKKLKSMDKKLRMTEKEQQKLLNKINHTIDNNVSHDCQKSTRWKYYVASIASMVIIFLLAFPFLNSTLENQLANNGFLGNIFSSSIYEGPSLNIGVIGEEPKVREKNIYFQNINFTDLSQLDSVDYDAIFIMKEFLSEAAEDKHIPIYQDLKLPIFFIESEKADVPFVTEGLTYDEVPNFNDQMYITGIRSYGTEDYEVFGFGLYNDIKNEKNILETYSIVFEKIESMQ